MTTLVKDAMSHDVAIVRDDEDVHELERMLLRERIHGVPVVSEERRLVGVVTQTDLLAWHFETGVDGAAFYDHSSLLAHEESPGLQINDIRAAKVREIMSPLVYCIGPDRPIPEAAAMMIRKWIHRLVVVDAEHHVLGVISAIDLLHSLPGTTEVLREGTEEDESQDT